MIIRNFYHRKLAQMSYLIGCPACGEAIVIDPMRDIRPYFDAAKTLGLRIVAATETHIHADYLSGTRELAAATGATMYLSAEGGPDWQYGFAEDPEVVQLHDGDVIQVGKVSLRAMHTPGHTPEHMAFLLTDHPVSASPHSLFSGDCVFVGDVGRPDLLERAAKIAGTMESSARSLHRSLKSLGSLSEALLVWPGHGAGSSCGKSLGDVPVTTLGRERATNWAFLVGDESKFVDEVTSGQPEPPNYFKDMKRLNKIGPPVLGHLPSAERIDKPVGQLIDVRDFDVIHEGNYDDAIAVPECNSFTGWAGWVIRYDEPVTLISDSQVLADNAVLDLSSIGIDTVVGWVHPQDLHQFRCAPIETVTAKEMDRDALVLDVRSTKERFMSQVAGSVHIPFGYLPDRLNELPKDRKIVVHCAMGGRSLVAYSILRKAGFKSLQELPGGMDEVETETPELLAVK